MASKVTEFLRATAAYKAALAPLDEATILAGLSDEQFRLLVYTSAELFSRVKKEAIRRGIWDEFAVAKRSEAR